MHQSFATGVGTSKPRVPAPRRGAALLGIFAILLQAALFAWHHHPLPLSSWRGPAVLAAAPASGQGAPGLADDDCQICFALSHHGAVPVDLFAASPPDHLPIPAAPETAVTASLASYLLFRSRAPPRA